MVHALEETWRVLRPDGVLVDLRPIASSPPVDALSEKGYRTAGHIDDSGRTVDDLAADDALDQVVGLGLFKRDEVSRFKFSLYWDSVEDMQSYVEENWSESQQIPSEVLGRAKNLSSEDRSPARARIQRKLHLAIFDRIQP